MSKFKVTPTERATGNTAPSFFVEARTEKEVVKNAVSRSRLLETPDWKPVLKEYLPKGVKQRRGKNKSGERVKMLILPDYKKKAA